MKDPTHTSHNLQDAKQIPCASSSPSPYPVSIRSYKKKDYEYLSSFPRMSHSHLVLRQMQGDARLLQDCESDVSMTGSSVGYTTSNSSASSASSGLSYAKDLIASMDAGGYYQHQHYQQQQQQQQQQEHQHHLLSTQAGTNLPPISVDSTYSSTDTKDDKLDDKKSADAKDAKLDDKGDVPAPFEKASAQVKGPARSQSKPKQRPHNAPAVLPKFGSWDTKNPSSGDAYTLIFKRLRDEKKSGGLPMSPSPTHSDEEEAVEPLSQESKAKEPLHANSGVQKDSSRRKANCASHQEAAYNRKHATKWNFCCKASALDD